MGTSPEATTQALNRAAESRRSSGWVVAVRSRQIRPEPNRSSYEAVAMPDAMRLSPPWGHLPWYPYSASPGAPPEDSAPVPYRMRTGSAPGTVRTAAWTPAYAAALLGHVTRPGPPVD